MLRHYLILTLRHFWRNKFYTFISAFGLSLGIAAFLVIVQYVRFELSYEDMHPHSERLYRVTMDAYDGEEFIVSDCETPMPLAPTMKEKYPEVESIVRVQDMDEILLMNGDDRVIIRKYYAADPSMFDVFGYKVLFGEPQKVFDKPFVMVIDQSTALKHFGKTNVVGQVLKHTGLDKSIEIVGVIEDVPQNTHLKFQALISFETLKKAGWEDNFTAWGGNNNFTYFRATKPLDVVAFNKKLAAFSHEQYEDDDSDIFAAETIRSIHLYSNKTFEPEANSDINVIYFLSIIAAFILIIAFINYINLYSAKALEKSKEISVRQVLGTTKTQMFFPNLLESFILCTVAGLMALVWIDFGMGFLLNISDGAISFQIFQDSWFWILFGVLLFSCAFLAGTYAQFMLSFFKIRDALKGTPKLSKKSFAFQKSFIVGQYVATFALIIGTVIVIKQLNFMMTQDLGMEPEQVLVVRGPKGIDAETFKSKSKVFKKELLKYTQVENVSSTNTLPGIELHQLSSTTDFTVKGSTQPNGTVFYYYETDENYLDALGMQLVAGENFAPNQKNKGLLINEETMRIFGIKDAETAIGMKVKYWDREEPILGVIKDFRFQSLKEAQIPMVLAYNEFTSDYFAIKIKRKEIKATSEQVKSTFLEVFPDEDYRYFFLDDHFNRQYHNEVKFAKLSGLFAFMAIFISCLGLVGISAYVALRRNKEVAIRKVLGATIQQILVILSSDYLKRILIACVIATPFTYYALQQWLQGFAYRTEISWWLFPLGAFMLVGLGFIVMSVQGLKAALNNPVDSLRDE